MEMYLVGGAVRDEIMGVSSKDLDYAVVLQAGSYSDPYQWMVDELESEGYRIFRDKEGLPIGHEHFTARARSPIGEAADFVLARREGPYSDGRHPDYVFRGTLEDDLNRRDFTMNAIAKDLDGNLIDPHNGVSDINRGIIRAVGDPHEKLREDALRAIRAIRFMVTKGMSLHLTLADALQDDEVLDNLYTKIADERIADELNKMLHKDTYQSLKALHMFPKLMDVVFSGKVSLDATLKTKGRG